MKIRSIISALFSVSLIVLSGCDDKLEEMNTNPLALSEISDEYLFTTAVRETFGDPSDILRFSSQYSHIYVTNSEMRAADSYLDFHTQDLYKYMYTRVYVYQQRFINEVLYLTASGKQANPVRHSLADIVSVINFSDITDSWGDIPYFDGARGSEGILYPAYDRQEDIYHDMLARLKDDIDILKTADPATAYPGADPIYGNDLDKWIRFANSLRLRLAMRMRFADPQGSAVVISECMSGPFIETNAQNFELKHEISDNSELYNPWNDVRRYQNWKMSKMFTDWLTASADPRLGVLIEKNTSGEYKGVPNGLNDQAVSQIDWTSYSNPASVLYAKDVSEYQMCAAEVWFLRAEAALFGLGPGDAGTLYRQGITADMLRWKIDAATINSWLAANPEATLSGSAENKFRQISTQMWVAFVPNFPQAWYNIRRTGYPEVPQRTNETIYSLGVTDGWLPKRFKYSSSEYLNNNANVTAAVQEQGADLIDTPVWWDVRGN